MAGYRRDNVGAYCTLEDFAVLDSDTRCEMFRILSLLQCYFDRNGRRPIPFYLFVTDPDSFHCTLRNMYHASLLLQYGLVGMVYYHNVPSILPLGRSRGPNVRLYMGECSEMDIPLWRNIIQSLRITRPMIPPPWCQQY